MAGIFKHSLDLYIWDHDTQVTGHVKEYQNLVRFETMLRFYNYYSSKLLQTSMLELYLELHPNDVLFIVRKDGTCLVLMHGFKKEYSSYVAAADAILFWPETKCNFNFNDFHIPHVNLQCAEISNIA